MSKRRWNGFAVAGFVLSFTNCLLGLIFSVIGIGSAAKYNEKGKGLAIAGVVISMINMIVLTIAICVITVFLATFVTNIPNMVPNDALNRAQESIIETYAKDQYENTIYSKNGIKKIKKMTEKGYTFTLEDMEASTPGIKDFYRSCDLKESKVTVYPVKPFNKTDYTIKTNLSCNN